MVNGEDRNVKPICCRDVERWMKAFGIRDATGAMHNHQRWQSGSIGDAFE